MHRLDTFPNKDMMQRYRNVFSAREGHLVLAHMCYELGVFSDNCVTPEDIALKNYASRLLNILGGGEVSIETFGTYVKNIVKQPIKEDSKNG